MTSNNNFDLESLIPNQYGCAEYADIRSKLATAISRVASIKASDNLSVALGMQSKFDFGNIPNPFVGIEKFDESAIVANILANHGCGKLWGARRCDSHKNDRIEREVPAAKLAHRKRCDEAAQDFDLRFLGKQQDINNQIAYKKADAVTSNTENESPANNPIWAIFIGVMLIGIIFFTYKIIQR